MSDPFSITGSAVGVISLGLAVAQNLYDLTRGVRHAREDIRNFESNVDSFKLVLNHVYVVLGDGKSVLDPEDKEHVDALLWRCTKTFVEIRDSLARFEKEKSDTKVKRALQRLQWSLGRDDMEAIGKQLNDAKTDLQAALHISQG
jgi:hypothetical protein